MKKMPRVKVWKSIRNAVGTQAAGECFQIFFSSPKLSRVFYIINNLIATRRKCFLLLLQEVQENERKITHLLSLSKCKFSLLMPSLCQQFCFSIKLLNRTMTFSVHFNNSLIYV